MEYASWFIGIQVTLFGIVITIFGIILPFIQNTRLLKMKVELKELKEFKKTYEVLLKDIKEKKEEQGREFEKFKQKINEQHIDLHTYNYEARIKKTKGIDRKTVQDELTAKGMNQDVIDGVIKNLRF